MAVFVVSLSCTSDAGTQPSTTTTSDGGSTVSDSAGESGDCGGGSGTTASTDGTGPGLGIRDARYCEVLPVTATPDGVSVEVYTTFGLGECPESSWAQLDEAAIAAELGVTAVILNGPRHFVMDEIKSNLPPDSDLAMFGELSMRRVARIEFPEMPSQEPYVERPIIRDTVFTFAQGQPIFELSAPDGASYVMQSYSLQREPALRLDTLAELEARLTLPEGWTFSTRTLQAPLDVTSNGGIAEVVQDDLDNTYQKR